jgi:hypothetical protein
MATVLATSITTYPGRYLATLTTANTGYAFTYPTGVPLKINIQPHANAASVAFTESAIEDGVTAIVPADELVIGSEGLFSFVVAPESGVRLPRATQFVLASATAGTKVLIFVEEMEG